MAAAGEKSPAVVAGIKREDCSRTKHDSEFSKWQMKDKKAAEKTETWLLGTFDYAWNKRSNGTRRPSDIIQKLDKIASSTNRFRKMSKEFIFFREGQVGIKIQARKPTIPESIVPTEEDSKNYLSGIFKLSRSQPRLISDKCGVGGDFTRICGFVMNDGITCGNPPVPGRKRCEEHEGRRIYGSLDKAKTGSSSNPYYLYGESSSSADQECSTLYTVCGVKLGDRTFCGKQPVPGRKRCEEHKGMRVNSSISKPITEDKCHVPAVSSTFTTSDDCIKGNASSSIHACRDDGNEHCSTVCGATLGNGSFCRRQPIPGNKRCWQHKGKRVDVTLPVINSSIFTTSDNCIKGNASSSTHAWRDNGNEHCSTICGATLGNGSFCRRQPIPGNKRCWQHKGKRVDSTLPGINSSIFTTSDDRTKGNASSSIHARRYNGNEHCSIICGAMLGNGSFCRRQPIPGNKRCWQHKGKRV